MDIALGIFCVNSASSRFSLVVTLTSVVVGLTLVKVSVLPLVVVGPTQR